MRKVEILLKKADGDPAAQISDLVVFMGYFSICLYAGGTTYRHSYNNALQFDVLKAKDPVLTGSDFVTNALFHDVYGPIALAAIVLVSVIFFLSRFIWGLLFSYFALSIFLCAVFLCCVLLGDSAGRRDAMNSISIDHVEHPKISFDRDAGLEKFNGSDYRLLSEDSDYLYVFVPQIKGSQIGISAIKKTDVRFYEVTVQ